MPEWTTPTDPAPPAAPKPLASWYAQGLSDGLGDRLLMFDNSSAPSLELLRFRPDLADLAGFEAALREQVRRLDQFRDPAFARIRAVQRLEPDDDLALISNCTPGKRLSEVLHRARGAAFAAAVIHQLGPALLLFQQHGSGIAHGALSPDRIIVSPDGQFTIVEHVVGPAIDRLGLDTARLRALGIALPSTTGDSAARLDVANDWFQLGLVAMSALLGRPVTATDLPQLERLLDGMSQSAGRDGTAVSPWMRQWLDRALQISATRIESSSDARAALDELLDRERHGEPRRPVPAGERQASPEPVRAVESIEAVAPQPPPAPVVETAPRHVPEGLTDFGSEAELTPKPVPPAAPPLVARQRDRVPPPAAPAESPRPASAPAPAPAPAPRPAVKRPPVVRDPRPAARPRVQARPADVAPPVQIVERHGHSTALVAALLLVIGVQAGVIALMARALWFAPPPAIAVKKDASGENVLVSSKPAESTPLRLSAAPDLSWVSVTSPSAAGIIGGKGAAAQTGTIRIASPIPLKIIENARAIGSVPGADLKVKPGKHEIELVNAAFGYTLKQSIEVEAGQTVSIHVAPAQGWATLYAVPTAEVTIDGQAVGRTPLGPLPLALGEHTITFKHPTGATDRQRITIKSGETVRVIGNPRR